MTVQPINIANHRRQKGQRLMIEMAHVLNGMGGSAHLSSLIAVLCAQRRTDKISIPDDIGLIIQKTLLEFDTMADDAPNRIFHRPFGPDSNRWALSDTGARVAQEVEALLEDTGLPKDALEAIETARRGVLRILWSGDKASPIDLTVLDELERRGKIARLKTRH